MTLFRQTVNHDTWDLLEGFMSVPELKQFALVGGTNLSLRLGHRISRDIDLFTNTSFIREEIWEAIYEKYPGSIKLGEREQTLWLNVDGVKVDVILHKYPYLRAVEEIDGIRLVAVEDIIPMKLEAMATRGVKKDFWDLAALLQHFSLAEMLSFHQQKYQQSDLGHIILSMTYFEDAEKEKIDPMDLKGVKWEEVKGTIRAAVLDFLKNQ